MDETELYRYTNVNASDIPHQLQLNLNDIETPYLWVSNTGSNTVAQISAETRATYDVGDVIRVVSLPGGNSSTEATDPSRTAVDVDFNCWVGYRDEGNAIGRLGAADPGLDRLFPNTLYSTDQGITEAWDRVRAVAINAEGNIWVGSWDNTNMRLVEPSNGRVLNTYSADQPVFATAQNFDPAVADESIRPVIGGGNTYGFAIDAFGNLWVAQRDNFIGQYDAHTGAHIETYNFSGVFGTSMYGIAVDVDGNVWAGNYSGNGLIYLPRRAAVDGQRGIEECLELAGNTCTATAARLVGSGNCALSRGVTVDQAGTAWVNCFNNNNVMQVAINEATGEPVRLGNFAVGSGPLGITATADGYIWSVNWSGGGPGGTCRGSNHGYTCPNGFAAGTGSTTGSNCNLTGGTVTQVRASNGTVVATYPTCGNNPYTYSDMAGYTLRSVTLRSGWWRSIHDATAARTGLEWGRIDWNGSLPGGTATPPATRIQLSLGASDNPATIDTEDLPHTIEVDLADGGVDIEDLGLTGQYLAIEAFFFTRNDFLGPVIEDITASSVCIATGETCNGFDDDCDGEVDEVSPGVPITGGACNTGLPGICSAGIQTCQGGAFVCVQSVNPQPEICNGADENCNDIIDDGVLNACGTCGPTPTEVCNGTDDDCDTLVDEGVQNTCLNWDTCETFLSCAACPAAPAEFCDGEDNNCNGQVDEGTARGCVDYRPGDNLCGIVQVCGDCPEPPAETCNGIDDNCNGLEDEGVQNTCFNFPDCSTYLQCGTCPAGPPEECDGLDNNCNDDIDEGVRNNCGTCGDPPPEVCDGIDNNCDGTTDENVSNACGLCGELPREVCDGIDNDCDGTVDDGVANRCGTCGPEPFETCNGLDDNCDTRVDEGVKNQCGTCGPVPEEICDGIDNDCNLETDEGTEEQCEAELSGSVCVFGECALPCFAGECDEGKVCREGYCISDPCTGVECAQGFRCTEGECINLCEVLNVTCNDGLVCVGGNCVENVCTNTGCPEGQACVENECVADPCFQIECGEDQVCEGGSCIEDPCLTVTCEGELRCVGGDCVDPCLGVTCGRSELCEVGFCVSNPCFDTTCPSGAVCVEGNCVEEDCVDVVCGDGQVCRGGDCFTTRVGGPCGDDLALCGDGLVCYENVCRDENDPELEGLIPGGGGGGGDAGDGSGQAPASGGCDCSTTGGSGALGLAVGLFLAVVAARRRRA